MDVESCALFGSRVGGSAPKSILRTCSAARSAALGAALSAGAVEAPGAVDAAGAVDGADEVVAPPQAAAITAMLARMPKSRFCMDSPSKRVLREHSRYRGPIQPLSTPHRLPGLPVEPPARNGRQASSSGSMDQV